jgi:hypothetical protein
MFFFLNIFCIFILQRAFSGFSKSKEKKLKVEMQYPRGQTGHCGNAAIAGREVFLRMRGFLMNSWHFKDILENLRLFESDLRLFESDLRLF